MAYDTLWIRRRPDIFGDTLVPVAATRKDAEDQWYAENADNFNEWHEHGGGLDQQSGSRPTWPPILWDLPDRARRNLNICSAI